MATKRGSVSTFKRRRWFTHMFTCLHAFWVHTLLKQTYIYTYSINTAWITVLILQSKPTWDQGEHPLFLPTRQHSDNKCVVHRHDTECLALLAAPTAAFMPLTVPFWKVQRGECCLSLHRMACQKGYWLQLPHSVFWETIKGIRRGNSATDVFRLCEFINQDCSVTPSCQPYWSLTFTSVAESILFAPPVPLFKSVWPLDSVDRKSPEFKLTWLEGLQLQIKSEKTNKRRKEMLQYTASENNKYKVTSNMVNTPTMVHQWFFISFPNDHLVTWELESGVLTVADWVKDDHDAAHKSQITGISLKWCKRH